MVVSGVIVVSACLLGINCRYDGKAVQDSSEILRRLGYQPVPLCPEQLSGLPTPRECCEIVGGDGFDVLMGKAKVLTKSGRDVTSRFIMGAREAYKVCKIVGADLAILKDLSPSCGVDRIYDGSFTGRKKFGSGVTTAYLANMGINVKNINTFIKY